MPGRVLDGVRPGYAAAMGARAAWSATAIVALLLAACGSSHPVAKGPPAPRVCGAAREAAAATLHGPVAATITDRDPGYIQCTLSGRGVGLTVLAEASAAAYTAYDTAASHLAQAFGAAGKPQNPLSVPGVGAVASWFPVEDQLVATNATQFRGGSFVNVTVTHWSPAAGSRLALVRSVARRVFAVAPRGPNPGPPPS